MELRIDAEFELLIDSLSDDERQRLEQKLEAEGCWQHLAVWTPGDGDGVPILLDGHNRYTWCQAHEIIPSLFEVPGIESRDDAIRWIIANQLGRRNLSDYRKIELARREEEILKNQAEERKKATQLKGDGDIPVPLISTAPEEVNESIAKKAGVGSSKVREAKFIDRWGTEEEKESLRKKERSIHGVYKEVEERLLLQMWDLACAGESQRQMAERFGMAQSNLNKWLKKARERFAVEEEDENDEEEEVEVEPHTYEQAEEDNLEETENPELQPQLIDEPIGHVEQNITSESVALRSDNPVEDEVPFLNTSMDGYRRWLDVFRGQIACLGGIDDVGGMQAILGPLSLAQREHIVREMTEWRDELDRHLKEANEMMQRDLVPVHGEVMNG